MPSRTITDALVAMELRKQRPRTQDACCAVAASVAVMLETKPWTDVLVLDTAASMAAGLFGEAFNVVGYDQKTAWIDMCERELRKVLAQPT